MEQQVIIIIISVITITFIVTIIIIPVDLCSISEFYHTTLVLEQKILSLRTDNLNLFIHSYLCGFLFLVTNTE